ncbi:MAG: DUF2188 domain-containing protein, partial [Cyclobacteriaceae bacterium]|nr:DUF2188 domain-containing protein [Cyclobacteriaceae bacterium]
MAKKNSEGGGYKRAHVISRSSGWAVKKEGTSRVAKVYFKKDSAVKGAKRLVTCERVHVISRSSRWAVKKEGTFRVAKVYFKKDSAVKGAKR